MTRFERSIALLGVVAALGCDEAPGAAGTDAGDGAAPDAADAVETVEAADGDGEETASDADGEVQLFAALGASFPASSPDPFGTGPVTGMFCRCDPPIENPSEILLENGTCRLSRHTGELQDWSGCTPLDVGDVTVEIGGVGRPVALRPDVLPCFFAASPDIPEPALGAPIRFLSTGGADVPAFDRTLRMVPAVATIEPAEGATLVAGDPWTFSWDPSDAGPVDIQVSESGGLLSIFCRTSAPSPFAVPAAFTAPWADAGTSGSAGVKARVLDDVPGNPPVQLSVTRFGDLHPVRFAAAP